MNIPSSKYLKNKARNRLASGQEPQKVVLYYAAGSLASAFLVTAVRYALDSQISETGGLHNIGLRSILTTANSVLPILQSLFLMCLGLGYLAAMLRIGRRQYASPKTLKAGFERFWVMLRSRLLIALMLMGLSFAALYASSAIFVASPFSRDFMDAATAAAAGSSYDAQLLAQNPDLVASLLPTMGPLLVIYAILVLAIVVPLLYSFRLSSYLIIDKPQHGASFALQMSRSLMRGNRLAMLKLDLSFWWYYLLQALAAVLVYADVILALMGISLPVPDVAAFFGSYLLYLAAEAAIFWYFRNYVSVTYALAYDSLVPKESSGGVVLGNIFQMQ